MITGALCLPRLGLYRLSDVRKNGITEGILAHVYAANEADALRWARQLGMLGTMPDGLVRVEEFPGLEAWPD